MLAVANAAEFCRCLNSFTPDVPAVIGFAVPQPRFEMSSLGLAKPKFSCWD
jgi:hypothetical protein